MSELSHLAAALEVAHDVDERDRVPLLVGGLHVADVARLLAGLNDELRTWVVESIPDDLRGEVLLELSDSQREDVLEDMPVESIQDAIVHLDSDDAADLIQDLDAEKAKEVVEELDSDERREVEQLLSYGPNTAGGLMQVEIFKVRQDWVPETVMDVFRRFGKDIQTVHRIFLVDDENVLTGMMTFRDLILAEPGRPVLEAADREPIKVLPEVDQEEIARLFQKHDLVSLPVVDRAGHLLGRITIEDVMDVVAEEASEDIYRMGGVETPTSPYLATNIFSVIKTRAGWLAVLFVGEMMTTSAMTYFEDEIAKAVVLALFVPLIMSSGGNSGSQACTLIIRAMALGEVTLRDWWKVMRREFIAGLGLGLILAVIGGLRILAWQSVFHTYGLHAIPVALTVAFSLVGVVLWGTVSGSMLPFLLRRVGFDPASASAPFVATLVDVVGILIYFSVASVVLAGNLL